MVAAPLDELFASVLFQLAIGGVGGFLIGILIRKVVKLALVIGLIVFSVIILAYTNIIDIDYNSLSDAMANFVNTINPALEVIAPLLASLPFIASLVVGFVIGFRRE